MVVRILHEGQYDVDGQTLDQLNQLDGQLLDAVSEGDETRFQHLFSQILGLVRRAGRPLAVEDLRPSELVLPAADSTMEEVRSLLTSEGLIAGM